MPIIIDKPFKSYSEQINLIRNKNVLINDVYFAENVLSSISYHTLINGSKKTFCDDSSPGKYKNGTTLEMIFSLYLLESKFNSTLLKYILFVEKSLKAKIGYLIGSKYGVNFKDDISNSQDNYLYYNNYSSKSKRLNNTLIKIIESYNNSTRNPIIAHYTSKNTHIPPWILFTVVPLGQIINFYTTFKFDDKSYICSKMLNKSYLAITNDDKEFFIDAINLMHEYRNTFAHGNKIMQNNVSKELSKNNVLNLFNGNVVTDKEYSSGMAKNGTFALILVLISLIDNKYILAEFQSDIEYIINIYQAAVFLDKSLFDVLNIPVDILNKIDLAIKNK